jgi:Arc/MetJ-type ribon-helix-helix transcriptional regulator
MRVITFHISEVSLEGLDELVRLQKYPNRSEAIRLAIRDLLKEELWNNNSARKARYEMIEA